MSKVDKFLKFGIIAFILLVISNGIPSYSGEYLEEKFINYDQPVSRNDRPGNEEKVRSMTSEQVIAMWQLEVIRLSPEQVAAEKAAINRKIAQDWQLVIGGVDEAWELQVNPGKIVDLNGRRPLY